MLISAWSGTDTSGLSQAAFSSAVTADRAASMYSRSAPWTCGTTRNDSASWTDRAAPGSSSGLPASSARRWSAAATCPGIGLARPTAGCRTEVLAPVASIDSAAATSAAWATRAARATTSAAWPTDTPLAEISASPSLSPSTSGAIPARRRASPPGRTSPRYSARPMPIATCARAAICGRSPAPTEAVSGTTGCTPAFSIATRISATATPAPDPPRAIPFSRTARAARTTSAGSGGPIPPPCDMTRNCCSPRISCSVSRVSLPWPTWVVRP